MLSAACAELARLPAALEPCEQLSRRHVTALGSLFRSAFQGTVEDDGRVLADPVGDMRRAIDGGFGALVEPASLGIGGTEALRAAVVTVLMDGGDPLVAFCMTAPQWQRHGYATGLISAAAGALAEADHERVFLAVHPRSPARVVYQRMGFEPV